MVEYPEFTSPRAEACFERAMDVAEIAARNSDKLNREDYDTLRSVISDLKVLANMLETKDSFEMECG